MNLRQLEQTAENYPTPFYIFDLDQLEQHTRDIRTAVDGRAKLCFAMKANPFLAGEMSGMVDRIEICSFGEFLICRKQGIPPEQMIISGVLKKQDEMELVLNTCRERALYTIESWSQYELLCAWSRNAHEKIRVVCRYTSGNQFGVDRDAVLEMTARSTQEPYLQIVGLHFYSGTQKRSVQAMQKELSALCSLARECEQESACPMELIEYGPGLQVSYFVSDAVKYDGLQAISTLLDQFQEEQLSAGLTLEMGRLLAACAGYYVTTVLDTKENNGVRYGIVDGGMHQLHYDGQFSGMYQPYVKKLFETQEGTAESWTICGELCSSADVLVKNKEFHALKTGDKLVFEQAGAYAMTEGMALFLSHELPAVLTYQQKYGSTMLRKKIDTWNMNMEEKNGTVIESFE